MNDPVESSGAKITKKKKNKKDVKGAIQPPPTNFADDSLPSPKREKSFKRKKRSKSKSPKRDKKGNVTEKSPKAKKKQTTEASEEDTKLPGVTPLHNRTEPIVVETVDEDDSSNDELPAVTDKRTSDEDVHAKIEEKKEVTGNELDANTSGESHSSEKQEDVLPPLKEAEKNKILRDAREYLNADIRLISACKDEEQTSDCSNVMVRFGLRPSMRGSKVVGYDGGACTSVILKALYEHHKDPHTIGAPKWIDLLHRVRAELKEKGYKQVPALTSSRPVSMKHEFNIIPKNHNGNRKALVIGVRYKGQPWELPGCHNDCHNMIKYLKSVHDFKDEDITILMDDGAHTNPTRENIVKAFHRFAFGVKAGDAAFFHFSGHGSSKFDESGDEESGFDQTLMPVDVMTKGDIVDDEIFRILLVPLPRGLQLTAFVDCCHSGTVFDLPFEFIGDSKYESGNEMDFRKVSFPHMKMVRAERRRIQALKEGLKEGNATESFVESKIVAAPGQQKKAPPIESINQGTDGRKKKLKPAFPHDDEPVEMPVLPKGQTTDNPFLIAMGCCLLCLNPCKLFRT